MSQEPNLIDAEVISPPDVRMVVVQEIRIDPALQSRAAMNAEAVADYARIYVEEPSRLPPVVVYEDEDGVMWLCEGFHRVQAIKSIWRSMIRAEVRLGSREDALLASLAANVTHGVQRTRDDKRKAVRMLLSNPTWAAWSDHKIAEHLSVSHPFVGDIRRLVQLEADQEMIQKRQVERNGKTFEMNVGGIQNANAARPEKQVPQLPSAAPSRPFQVGDKVRIISASHWGYSKEGIIESYSQGRFSVRSGGSTFSINEEGASHIMRLIEPPADEPYPFKRGDTVVLPSGHIGAVTSVNGYIYVKDASGQNTTKHMPGQLRLATNEDIANRPASEDVPSSPPNAEDSPSPETEELRSSTAATTDADAEITSLEWNAAGDAVLRGLNKRGAWLGHVVGPAPNRVIQHRDYSYTFCWMNGGDDARLAAAVAFIDSQTPYKVIDQGFDIKPGAASNLPDGTMMARVIHSDMPFNDQSAARHDAQDEQAARAALAEDAKWVGTGLVNLLSELDDKANDFYWSLDEDVPFMKNVANVLESWLPLQQTMRDLLVVLTTHAEQLPEAIRAQLDTVMENEKATP